MEKTDRSPRASCCTMPFVSVVRKRRHIQSSYHISNFSKTNCLHYEVRD